MSTSTDPLTPSRRSGRADLLGCRIVDGKLDWLFAANATRVDLAKLEGLEPGTTTASIHADAPIAIHVTSGLIAIAGPATRIELTGFGGLTLVEGDAEVIADDAKTVLRSKGSPIRLRRGD